MLLQLAFGRVYFQPLVQAVVCLPSLSDKVIALLNAGPYGTLPLTVNIEEGFMFLYHILVKRLQVHFSTQHRINFPLTS